MQILSKLLYNLVAVYRLYFFITHKGILSFFLHSSSAWILYSLYLFPLNLVPY